MKNLIVLFAILTSFTSIAQDSLQTQFTLAQRTGSFAPRILKQLGTNAYTLEVTSTIKYKKYFMSVFLTKDLNSIAGLGPKNTAGNSLLLMTGKKFHIGKLSVMTRVGFFQPLGFEYFQPRIAKASLIPNIFSRYLVSHDTSIGVWANYFINFSGNGSAFTVRADYMKKYKAIGKLQYVINYNSGLHELDPVLNGGIHFSTKPQSISKDFTLHFDVYNYYNIIEFGKKPFTQNSFGIGVVLTTQ